MMCQFFPWTDGYDHHRYRGRLGYVKGPFFSKTERWNNTELYKAEITKKLASAIVYRLTPDRLTKRIKRLKSVTRKLFAADLNAYDATIIADNVGEKVTALLVEIIQAFAGLAPKNELARQHQLRLAVDLKSRYGDYRFGETSGYCPLRRYLTILRWRFSQRQDSSLGLPGVWHAVS